MTPLWVWELEPNKDYWITLRDWLLWCASRSNYLYKQHPTIFETNNLRVGTTLRIKLPLEDK